MKQAQNRPGNEPVVPVVYTDMLADAGLPALSSRIGRTPPRKRRKVGERVSTGAQPSGSREADGDEKKEASGKVEETDDDMFEDVPLQTAYNDSAESSVGDTEWEAVDLEGQSSTPASRDANGDLLLDFGDHNLPAQSRARRRRTAPTKADRMVAIQGHQLHILCLLNHVAARNHWCNDSVVRQLVFNTLPKKARDALSEADDEGADQFQRDRILRHGLGLANEAFKTRYKITARGMRRAYWKADGQDLAVCRNTSSLQDHDRPQSYRRIRLTSWYSQVYPKTSISQCRNRIFAMQPPNLRLLEM